MPIDNTPQRLRSLADFCERVEGLVIYSASANRDGSSILVAAHSPGLTRLIERADKVAPIDGDSVHRSLVIDGVEVSWIVPRQPASASNVQRAALIAELGGAK